MPSSDADQVPPCDQWVPSSSDPYDANGDGAFNVLDYVCDSRVDVNAGPHGAKDEIDAEDLIATFSDGTDADGNGFVDDIAGWDFFDNDNDPYDASSYFCAFNHGTNRASDAVERGNDGQGFIGVCPRCQVMPLRIWDTFVPVGNTFAMGILYATDNGAAVIEGAVGTITNSAFAQQASEYAYRNGVVQVYSGDDLNTANHNIPANYSHAMLIQGTVPDTVGLGVSAGQQVAEGLAGLCQLGVCPENEPPVGTYFRGANNTQYGGKSSVAMEGTSGSSNTGKAAGAAGLVISAAKDANPPIELRPDETREILEQTAERVTAANALGLGVADPGADANAPSIDQWTSHFGWGRVDLGAAASLANSGKIPPEAAIDTPDWFAPLTGDTVEITGLARARFADGGAFHWKLDWGPGWAPTQWTTVAEGDATATVTDFGRIDLKAVRNALTAATVPTDTGGPVFSPTEPNPFQQQFTVRLTVTADGISTPGVDRRVLTAFTDDTLRVGYPMRLGAGGDAPLRYADLNGDNVPELIVPGDDGVLRVLGKGGSELPGFPVHTQIQYQAADHLNARGFSTVASKAIPYEELRGVAIADLDGDGIPEIIGSAGIHVYVWEPDGSRRPGFPVTSNLDFCRPSLQSQPLVHPKCGFVSSPAVGHLEGPGKSLDIVAPSMDGHLYAFDDHGRPLPGFPVRLADPSVPPDQQMIAEESNEPAVGDLNGDAVDDVIVATDESYGAQAPSASDVSGLFAQALSDALAGVAGGSSRVYAVNGATGQLLPGWPVKLNGAVQNVLPLIGPGQDPAIANIGGQTVIVASTTGSAAIEEFDTSGNLLRSVQQTTYGTLSNATDRTGTINIFENATIGQVIPGGGLDIVKYGLSLSGLANLLLNGQNVPYNHLISAYDATTGAALPAYPVITDDYQLLSSNSIGKVVSGSSNQILSGTGLGLLHAYDGLTGQDATGFPKVTGGWLFAPAELSQDGRIAAITREGYLFEWDVQDAPACQPEWPTFRHDPHNSGNYDTDGTPPGAVTGLAATRDSQGVTVQWVAPGDDGLCDQGSVNHYLIGVDGQKPADPGITPSAPRSKESHAVPHLDSSAHTILVQAVDDAGNVGYPQTVSVSADGGGSPSGGTSSGGTSSSGGGSGPMTPGLLLTFGGAWWLRRRRSMAAAIPVRPQRSGRPSG